jgi:uncharacterized protein YegJ (DUF2314 family)
MIELTMKRIAGVVLFLFGIGLLAWLIQKDHSLGQWVTPILCLLVGWIWMRSKGKGIEQVIPPDLKCPELETAVARARATLPEFIAEVAKGIDGAFVKFPLVTPQGFTEHIWAYVHFYADDRFNVSLANTPYDQKMESDGRRDVPASEVEDWQIMNPDGTIRGAYSLVALFEYWTSQGHSLTPRMKVQKASLLTATDNGTSSATST